MKPISVYDQWLAEAQAEDRRRLEARLASPSAAAAGPPASAEVDPGRIGQGPDGDSPEGQGATANGNQANEPKPATP
jgi:hypothetical protein